MTTLQLLKLLGRFWSKVDKSQGCWTWLGGRYEDGYGQFTIFGKESMLAHRVSWILHNGLIKEDMKVCHKCDNPSCVNPTHLFLGTQKQNMEDMVIKDRRNHVKGSKHPLARLNEAKVREIKKLNNTGLYVYKEIGNQFGISASHVHHIIKGDIWKGVGDIAATEESQ